MTGITHAATLNSIESEKTVLGTIMMTERSFPRFKGVVVESDFFYAEHTRIFEVMSLLHDAGRDINLQTLRNVFKRDPAESERYSESFLTDILDYSVPVQHALSSASQISEMSGRRKLARYIDTFQKDLLSLELNDLIGSMQKTASEVSTKGVTGQVSHGSMLVANTLKMLSAGLASRSFIGIPEVDDQLFDVSPGETVVIAARPGTGKTTLMLQAVRHLAFQKKKRPGFLSMEMYDGKLALRLVAGHCKVDLSMLLTMNDEEFESNDLLYQGLVDISENVWIEHEGTFSASTVQSKIQNMVYNYGCDIIFVDYIGLIKGDKTTPGDRQQQVSDISRMLKNMATELYIPIIIAAQLNRAVEHRVSNRPMLSDLRESGSIEQDASIVLFLYADIDVDEGMSDKDFQKKIDDMEQLPVILECAKQRNGPKFRKRLIFNKPTMNFVLAEGYYDSKPNNDDEMPFAS